MEEIKRRRGRPRKEHLEISIKVEAEYSPDQARGYCPRSVQNHVYILDVFHAMKNPRRCAWLKEERGDKFRRKTLLGALGRIAEKWPFAARVFGDYLCATKPTTADGLRMLRNWAERLESLIACEIVHMPEGVNTLVPPGWAPCITRRKTQMILARDQSRYLEDVALDGAVN